MRTSEQMDLANNDRSKIDSSGTDPNRYENFYPTDPKSGIKNGHQTKSLIPGLNANVGTVERVLMVAAGSYLLYKALSGNKKNASAAMIGGTMLARGVTGYCPIYDLAAHTPTLKSSNVNIRTTVVINRPISEVYTFWRNLENLPLFMKHLESVKETDRITSEWTARGPAGIGTLSWKAEILMDETDQMLSWHSLPGSTVDNAGKVRFRDAGNNSTELDVTISYHAPYGKTGETAAKMLNPLFSKMVTNDIQSLKTFLEAGRHNNQN